MSEEVILVAVAGWLTDNRRISGLATARASDVSMYRLRCNRDEGSGFPAVLRREAVPPVQKFKPMLMP